MISIKPHDERTSPSAKHVPNNSSNDSSCHFLKIILDLGYYAGVIPYHIKYDENLQEAVIQRSTLQTVCCLLIGIVTLFSQINKIRRLQLDKVVQDPTMYFEIFRRVLFLITFTAWFTSLWRKSIEFRTFVVSSYKALPGNYRKIAKTWITVLCLTNAFVGTMGSIFIVDKTYWDPADLMKAYLQRAKQTFPFQNLPVVCNQEELNEIQGLFQSKDVNCRVVLLLSCQLFLDFCHDMNAWMLYTYMTSIAFVTWLHVFAFKEDICSSSAERIDSNRIYDKYIGLKKMSININSILGPTLLAWVCYVVPYTALKISDFGNSVDWFLVVFSCVYFGNVFLFLVLAADSCAKVSCMNEWILRNDVMQHFDQKVHNALLIELQSNPVAIRSHNGVFTLTYGFIGNMFTSMTSFFIIITQFKMTGSSSLPA